jgi:hypothetical protein
MYSLGKINRIIAVFFLRVTVLILTFLHTFFHELAINFLILRSCFVKSLLKYSFSHVIWGR